MAAFPQIGRAWLTCATFALLLTGPVALDAQQTKTMLAEPPAPLLPATLHDSPDDDAANGVPSWSGPAAPILQEDGILRYERGSNPDGTVTVYQFGDATGAVAASDYLRRVSGRAQVMRSGVSVVVADVKPGARSSALLKSVQIGLPKIGGPKGLDPLLPTYLPAHGLDKESIRYSVGPAGYQADNGILPADIIGFDKAAEVVTAKYAGRGTLTLLLYPTPQIAGAHGRLIEAEMNRQGHAAGTVKLRREGPMLLMTSGSWPPAEAQALVEGIHLRDQVTFDKPMPPQFHTEVRKTYSLLYSIAVFCGLGALAAVILGLFLGGGRAAIRVLQGKPAASEPEFLRIDLSGQPTPIRPDPSPRQ